MGGFGYCEFNALRPFPSATPFEYDAESAHWCSPIIPESVQFCPSVIHTILTTSTIRCGRPPQNHRLYLACRSAKDPPPPADSIGFDSLQIYLDDGNRPIAEIPKAWHRDCDRHRQGVSRCACRKSSPQGQTDMSPFAICTRWIRFIYKLPFISSGAKRPAMIKLVGAMNLANVGYLGFSAQSAMGILAAPEGVGSVPHA